MDDPARQFLRALRGSRSQVAFSRRLGYRSNVAGEWEAGRRSPTAREVLRACHRVGVNVADALARFHPVQVAVGPHHEDFIGLWLSSLVGGGSAASLARRSGHSRHQIGRWLSGRAQPRLPDFFQVVDAVTGRVDDWSRPS